MRKGAFITLEGGEGAGKSTQLRLVGEALRVLGHDVLITREPGGSPGAEDLRQLLLFGNNPLSLRAEILAHFAARYDHVDHVILPALQAGRIVLCDRFTDSTLAYQGYGRAGGNADILRLIHSLTDMLALTPDRTFLLDVPRDVARERLAARAGQPDRYEQADEEFHARVAEGFAAVALHGPDRVRRLNTAQEEAAQISHRIVEDILALVSQA
ncbi:dTMP kinase [Acetobacter peroxydans]|jgi:dTMP kinase|uniref:dTMP kinase n=1 Tax=Acetobacter peroxydans TaxID=104098 RepID=UPI0023565C3F|nr:dTMP kinase [Acetobacter peroxydans]MCH4144137.1 dTMP kinase [Acetobacter peroxydans]MCI1394370.1 dTMP kinase [Acetobacter peroxydans]MCI1411113.1 dTMP kinase [Acetobacter peroxydans]MCI1440536.1 dTMP kinase [Acetobacter peroxydans]MCI1567085.1 dTMP kinase [Acetobacter peroxydans]